MEYRLRRFDGRYRWIEDRGVPRFDGAGTFAGYIGSCYDVTERKEASEAIRKSEEKFSRAFRASPVILALHAAKDNRLIEVNDTFLAVTGYRAEEVIGRTLEDLNIEVDRFRLDDARRRLLAGGLVRGEEHAYRMKDGEVRRGLISAELIELDGEPCVLSMVVDITEQKRAREELLRLSGRLIDVQEQERSRVARELHDDLAQKLALLACELQQPLLKMSPSRAKSPMGALLKSAWKQVEVINEDLHRVSRQLYPSILSHLGLVPALRRLCGEIKQQSGVQVTVKNGDFPASFSKDAALCLYRVAQEALVNVVKHSGSKHARIELLRERDHITMRITDSGRGFSLASGEPRAGLGLLSMKERLRLCGGEFSIQSRPSRGTRVEARVPAAQAIVERPCG
jgi:PAS domain S-box-containing protein